MLILFILAAIVIGAMAGGFWGGVLGFMVATAVVAIADSYVDWVMRVEVKVEKAWNERRAR